MENTNNREELVDTGLEKLFQTLRGGLYHFTTLEQFVQISHDGFIHPNDGSFPYSFGKSNSYAVYKRYIALFDLKSPSVDQCYDGLFFRWSFFLRSSPVTIGMELRLEDLEGQIIPNAEARKEVKYRDYIPHVEVWYPRPIALSSVKRCLVICNVGLHDFVAIPAGKAMLDEVLKETERYKILYHADYLKLQELQHAYDFVAEAEPLKNVQRQDGGI